MLQKKVVSADRWQMYWEKLTRNSAPVPYVIGIVLALLVGNAVLQPLRVPGRWMDFVQDDTFYYLTVARNLATGHGSTFNGIVPTNGYHPLWMLCFALVIWLRAGMAWVPPFLACSIWLSTLATFGLTNALFRRNGLPKMLGAMLAAAMAIYFMHLAENCMEVTLVVPLILAMVLVLQQPGLFDKGGTAGLGRGLLVGLLAAAIVLSRIDTLILIAMLTAGYVSQAEFRRKLRREHWLGLCLGFLPVVAYFLSNKWWFHVWLPVSGMAKQLKRDHGFTLRAWISLLTTDKLHFFNLLPTMLGLAVLPVVWRRLNAGLRATAPAILAYPFVYVGILSWCSDWKLWSWYFYMLRPALTVSLIVLAALPQGAKLLRWRPAQVVLILFCLLRIGVVRWDEQQPEIVKAALRLQRFSATHPGIYAMGDRSGSVGFLISEPVVQTEGLVMDSAFLKQIASGRTLRQVLGDFHVRYYVGSELEPYPGCFQAMEPSQAGPHAPHLQDRFCEPPLAMWTIEGVKTLVYDLQPGLPTSGVNSALPVK